MPDPTGGAGQTRPEPKLVNSISPQCSDLTPEKPVNTRTTRSGSGRRPWRGVVWLGLVSLTLLVQCGRRPPPALPPPSASPLPTPSPAPDAEDPLSKLAPLLELRVEPETIRPNQSALLTWQSENATDVVIEPNIGRVGLSGRIKFFPEQTTRYEIVATGPGGTVRKSVAVTVLGGSASIREEDLEGRPLKERFAAFVRPVFFAFDRADLGEEAQDTLDSNAAWLMRSENVTIRFVIEGHADHRGSEEYNLALADTRAQVASKYLISRGIDGSRMVTVSLGEERPFASGTTEEAYALNRRAHFVLMEQEEGVSQTPAQ